MEVLRPALKGGLDFSKGVLRDLRFARRNLELEFPDVNRGRAFSDEN
jgi:hypothetical protein